MILDAVYSGPPRAAAEAAQLAVKAGMAGLWVPETAHDPFLSLLQARSAAPELLLGTAIAVGFARSPMTLAQTSWDMAELTDGKFWLGLGSQVKAHIVRRFSMPWGKPVEQMRELLLCLRRIWGSFDQGTKLEFQGDYYNLSLLTPFFTPERHQHGQIPLGLAAVGPRMTELAGELADFVVLHSFTNPDYLRTSTVPALEAGLERSGRPSSALTRVGTVFVITGDAETSQRLELEVREQLAFYGSTPAYAPVLEAAGYGELAGRLHQLSRQGEWQQMGRLLPAEMLERFCVRGPAAELEGLIEQRFQGLYDRVMLNLKPSDYHLMQPR